MPDSTDIVDRLRRMNVCARCRCQNCYRGAGGELHNHKCTDGPHCVETRTRMRARISQRNIMCGLAAAEIERLRTLLTTERDDA